MPTVIQYKDVKFFEPEMDWLLKNPSGTVGRWLANRGQEITLLAKIQVGVKTGNLRNSIHMRHYRDPRGQYIMVGSTLNHALMHHEGTRPHVILPKNAKLLKFVSKGRLVYATRVMHPGTKANRYLKKPMELVVRANTTRIT